MGYTFNLEKKSMLDSLRSVNTYQLNLAMNLALLSNDITVIRKFFNQDIASYIKDTWTAMWLKETFLGYYEKGQACTYFGLIPMIVQGKVNLIASNGFNCISDDKAIEKAINKAKDVCELQKKFVEGAYLESGLGDFAYRISIDKSLSEYPLIDVIEPQNLEVNYIDGIVKSFIVKKLGDEPEYELCEIHSKNSFGYCQIDYKFRYNGKWVANNDENLINQCKLHFNEDFNLDSKTYPFKDFLIIYKQNENNSILYRRQRGVPDIQGLFTIEDALSETISGLIDAIRKGGIKEWVSDELIPQTPEGRKLWYNSFNKRIMTTKGSANPAENEKLLQVTQARIDWESYIKPIQTLMSVGINKAGLSPTTLGITGLESINSSQESQDAREKPSLRKREICLNAWSKTLTDLLNRWLQVYDYMQGLTIVDYSDLINIQFNEYTSPSLENITDVLARQVSAGIKSQVTAIQDLNKGWSKEQVAEEFDKITADRQGVLTIDKNIEETDNIE